MTNEEAIKALKRIRDEAINNFVGDWQDYEAFDIALKALADCKDEPQTMYYPQVDGITPSVIVQCYLRESCDHYGDKQVCGRCREYNLYSNTKTEMERLERIDNEIEDAWAKIRELTDEPLITDILNTCSFSDCDNFKNPDYARCIECKRKQIEAQTERSE